MSMRLRVIDVNFTTEFEWIFKLSDDKRNIAFIMNEIFYKAHKMKSPISKKELDYFDKGYSIKCRLENVENISVVTNIN